MGEEGESEKSGREGSTLPELQRSELISYNPSHVFDKSFMVPFSLLKWLLEIFIYQGQSSTLILYNNS